jgi:spore coat protein U-like protein
LEVTVTYLLKAVPATPARQMRDNELRFLRSDMFLDPARTRYWGDGFTGGTFAIQGALVLDQHNRVGTLVHQLYGKVDGGQIAPAGQWLGLVGAALEYQAVCTG